MPTYNDPRIERYALLGFAFGGSTSSRSYLGLPGRKGIVRDISACVTTAMVGTTSVPELRVGNAASDLSFARWLMGTNATTGLGTGAYRARTLAQNAQGRTGGKATQLQDFPHHVVLEGNDGAGSPAISADPNGFVFLPADTAFFITGVAGVGGTPAGTADVFVDIDWY